MIIDDSLGTDVNVSAILDEFILDETSSDVVIQFLSDHEEHLSEIWNYSDCYQRIFQIDYFLKSTSRVKDWILKHLKKIPIRDAAVFCWQCCSKNSPLDQSLQNLIRREFKWILKSSKVMHPYAHSCETYIIRFDTWIFEHLNDNQSFPEIIAEMPEKLYRNHMAWITSSLFCRRFYQLDVFAALDNLSQWIALNSIKYIDSHERLRFVSQILSSSLSEDIKLCCLSKVTDYSHWLKSYDEILFKHNGKLKQILTSTNSFDVIQLELAMRGEPYPLKNILLYYLLNRNFKMVNLWWKECHDEVIQVYDLEFLDNLKVKYFNTVFPLAD